MLSPKKVKFRKQMKGNLKGTAHNGCDVSFGDFGMQIVESGTSARGRSKPPVWRSPAT